MKRRFVILIDSDATKEERDAVTEHLKNSESYGFWHHFPFSWLVTTEDETITESGLRGEVRDRLGATSVIVIRVDDGTAWWAYGPPTVMNWLHETWSAD